MSMVRTSHGDIHVELSILNWDEIRKNPEPSSNHVRKVILWKTAMGTFFKWLKNSRQDFVCKINALTCQWILVLWNDHTSLDLFEFHFNTFVVLCNLYPTAAIVTRKLKGCSALLVYLEKYWTRSVKIVVKTLAIQKFIINSISAFPF